MASITKADGWQAAGQGIGNIFQAFALGPMYRQQAQQDAALKSAQTYSHNMHGNKYGAETRGLEMTNEARTAPIDASLPQYMQAAQKLFSMTGDTNMDRFASAGQRLQQMGAADTVMANPAAAATIGTAMAAAAGKGAYSAVGDSGVSVNQFTGAQDVNHPGLYDLRSRLVGSQIYQNNMQGNAANATAGLRYSESVGQQLENQIGAHDVVAAGQGNPLPSKRDFPGSNGASDAAMVRGTAEIISKVLADPGVPQDEKEALIRQNIDLFQGFMGLGGGGGSAAPAPATAPVAAPASAAPGGGKFANRKQIQWIAKQQGLTEQQVIERLKQSGFGVR